MTGQPRDQQQSDDELEINSLFDGIERRANPSAETLLRAKEQTNQVWQEVVVEHTQQQRRWRAKMALAATGLLAMAAAMVLRLETNATWTMELATGQLEVQQFGTDGIQPSPPTRSTMTKGTQEVSSGTTLFATQTARIHLTSGAELRLAEATQIQFLSADRLELMVGKLYIDTHERADLTLVTALGEVADIGTQYSVSQISGGLNIAVRSGSVVLTTAGNRYQVDADLTSAGIIEVTTNGSVSQQQELKSAQRWDWIHTAAYGYSSHQVAEVLEQIADDLGVELRYASLGDQAALANATYGGNLNEMTPKQALELLALSLRIRWTLADHSLVVASSDP